MGLDESKDQVLMQKLKKGNEQSFRKIYIKYHKQLYSTALRYLRSQSLAEDAVHEVFVKLWDNRDKLKTSGSLRGFLHTATKNHVLNIIDKDTRRLKKHIKLSNEKKFHSLGNDNIIDLSMYRGLYKSAVDLLPHKRREVFKLRIDEGLTNREVAEYLNISVHTVKSQYYKASNFIKEYVRQNISRETGS